MVGFSMKVLSGSSTVGRSVKNASRVSTLAVCQIDSKISTTGKCVNNAIRPLTIGGNAEVARRAHRNDSSFKALREFLYTKLGVSQLLTELPQ